jgi:hypothetical protein
LGNQQAQRNKREERKRFIFSAHERRQREKRERAGLPSPGRKRRTKGGRVGAPERRREATGEKEKERRKEGFIKRVLL